MRKGSWALRTVNLLALLIILGPIVIVVLVSFSPNDFFAFIVSFGELNTALFLTGPGVTTLPIEIFAYLQFQGSQLVIAAASTLQICLIIVLVVTIERLVGLSGIVY